MVSVESQWMADDASPKDIELLIDGIHDFLKSYKAPYYIVHIGDLLSQLCSSRIMEQEQRWVKALYTAVRRGHLSFLSGEKEQFAGALHGIDDFMDDINDMSLLDGSLLEPSGRIQMFVFLRNW